MSEEDIRKKGCFLHVVSYDTSFVRSELAKSLEYIQEYDVAPESRQWNRVKEHANVIIKEIENRKNFIERARLTNRSAASGPRSFYLNLAGVAVTKVLFRHPCRLRESPRNTRAFYETTQS